MKTPLYNSRVFKNYLEYIGKNYPHLEIEKILESAEITIYEIFDQGHWFSQQQADRFHEILIKQTGNAKIAADVGKYASSSEALGIIKRYSIGMMGLSSIYLLMDKLYPTMSRGAEIKSKKLSNSLIEIVAVPAPGVDEKPYQCENRLGSFESLGKLFSNSFAKIEHPECFHRGDKHCRYLISWEKSKSMMWKRFSYLVSLITLIVSFSTFFIFSIIPWLSISLILFIILMSDWLYVNHIEKQELINIIKTQGNSSKELFDEINTRHNNALLIHEIGRIGAAIMDISDLTSKVTNILENRLDFKRGLIMLVNKNKTKLVYFAGYGYDKEQKEILEKTEFHLEHPDSKGLFILAFKEQKPFLIEDILKDIYLFSEQSKNLINQLAVKSLICVPIIYEHLSFGVLVVDNPKSEHPFTQTDLNLLMGVASQIASSINNVFSFERLHESEKKYRDLVENSNSIIMRIDLEGKITFVNEFAQKLFGADDKPILGQNILGTIFSTDEMSRIDFAELLNFMQNDPNHQWVSETETTLKNGDTAWIAWNHKLIMNEEDQLNEILSIGNDITALKKSAQEKNMLEGQLQQAQKMEIIGTLAGGVAHDLNNLLSGIIGYPEIMLLDLPKDSPLRNSIINVKKSGERAAAIVLDLLTLARRGVPIRDVVNLNLTIKEYFNSPEYEKLKQFHPTVAVELNLDSNLQNIKGSSVHISKTLMNLVANAAEAMPNGGTIWVATINRHMASQTMVGKENLPEGDYVILTVTDNGIGISETDKEKIFEPFYTKKNMGRSGTGLGMTVVWGTVMDHKGYIDVQSKLDKGTRFVLYFPASREASPEKISPVSIETFMGKDQSILIVDDRLDQREMAMQMLRRLNYSVDAVESGEKAVDYILKNQVDLVLLDMMMGPGIDGLETYRRMLLANPNQKAIIFSGYMQTDRIKEAQNLGVGGFLRKPFSIEKIGLMIKKELEK